MDNPTTAIRTDSLPALATLLCPSIVALTPFTVRLLINHPEVREFFDTHENAAILLTFIVVLVSGFFIETLGSYTEYYIVEWFHKRRKAMREIWWEYLNLEFDPEPMGQNYLRRTLTQFKFELNMTVALAICTVGVSLLVFELKGTYYGLIATAIMSAMTIFTLKAAVDGSKLLAQIRENLVLHSRTKKSADCPATKPDSDDSSRK